MKKKNPLVISSTVDLVIDFFKFKIEDKELLEEYNEEYYPHQLLNIRIGHFFTSLVFIGFGIYDYFMLQDSQEFFLLNSVRFSILLLVSVPFYIFSFRHNFRKYIRPAIFINYLLFGAFLSYAVWVLDTDSSVFANKYYGLDLIILGVFALQTIKYKDTLLLSIVLIGIYNIVWVIIIRNNPDYVSGFIDLAFLVNFNIWLFTVVIFGSVLWKYNRNLSQKNFLIQRDLNNQKLEMKEADAVKNKFFNILTHDLKNLIGSQHSLTKFLAENYGDMAKAKEQEFIEMLENASSRTLNLFEELMLWVRAQTHEINTDPVLLNLNEVVNEVAELLQLELNTKVITISNQVESNVDVYCDHNSLKTILRNLLGNALKFSHPQSIIYVAANEKHGQVEVAIVDQGVGMSEQVMESLFKVNNMHTSIGTKGEKGTGLGLILTKELIELNKGSVRVESVEGQGTQMYVSLPKIKKV